MQSLASVTEQIRGNICEITFSSNTANSMTTDMLQTLARLIYKASQDKAIRVLFLKSPGDVFCSGASLAELSTITEPARATEYFMGFANVMLAIYDSPKPVVITVQGKVVGGGVGIIAAADWVIAGESASVKLGELSLGIGPFTVSPAIIKRIGIGAFQQLCLSTDWYGSDWCYQNGLFHTIAQKESFYSSIEKKLNHFASLDPNAFSENKKLITNFNPITKETFTLRAKEVSSLLLAPYAQEHIKKIKEKQ
jgi:methylglutaconyl-CoA hydratase